MDAQAIKAELLKCERDYWQSIKDQNPEAARRLTDFPCIIAGAQGVATMDEKTFGAMMNGGPSQLRDFKLADDAQVRLLTDEVAIVAYKVHEDLTVEGQPLTLEAADASVWIKRGGQWQCALHTESLAGDRFGRDRRQAH
jgi:hypothetical protein